MAAHVWVMMAVYGVSFEEARRMRTETNDRPVQLGQHNLKELRGPLCDNCGALFDVVVVYDKNGDRVETPCFAAGAKGAPAPEVRFGPEREDDGEPVRESAGSLSSDQPRQQGDHEGTGVAREPSGGELRLLPQRTDSVGGEVFLPEGPEPVQQGEPDRTGSLKYGEVDLGTGEFHTDESDRTQIIEFCRCVGECGDHAGQCRRVRVEAGVYCDTCSGGQRPSIFTGRRNG